MAQFVILPDGGVYLNQNGTYRHIQSPADFQSLTGSSDIRGIATPVQNLSGPVGSPVATNEIQGLAPQLSTISGIDPNQLQSNIKAATVAPITPQDQAGFQSQAASVFDPQKKALSTDLQAKLESTLAAGDKSLQNDLSSRGFLRSGEQITSSALQHTIAESDMALQEATNLSDINTQENSYANTLQANEVASRQQNAQTVLQNQATSMGITEQEFTNMQTELATVAQQSSTAFTQQNTVSQQQTALLTNPDFATLLTGLGSNPSYQPLILQMLQSMGFNVTA